MSRALIPSLALVAVALMLCVTATEAGAQAAAAATEISLAVPDVVLREVPFEASAAGLEGAREVSLRLGDGRFAGQPAATPGEWRFSDVTASQTGEITLTLFADGRPVGEATSRAVPGVAAIAPPLLAIAIALVFRSVIPALFLGAWAGTFAIAGFGLQGLWSGLLAVFEVHVRAAVADADHAAIVLFSLMIGGMVGIVSRNGGMQGVVSHIVRWASSARRGQLATALLGLAIFFDDYANTLIVGNTMRPVTDRLRISREKLAFLVDATAAPVACVALVTTWVGYEVGLIDSAVRRIEGLDQAGYFLYLNSIAYSFYPLLMIFFVLLVAGGGRDFAGMYRAEHRARTTGAVLDERHQAALGRIDPDMEPPADRPHRAINALLPVAVLVAGVLGGLYVTGEGDTLVDIIGSADSYRALMWGSLLGVVTATTLTLIQRTLTLEQTVLAWTAGVRAMMIAMIILVLAWSLGAITETLHAADYLASLLGDYLAPGVVPAMVFVLSGLTAFATGTSWGTMGILLPLVVPLTWAILELNGITGTAELHVLYAAIASVLSGAVWGDHCSPISDTTILSSMASGCDHVDHVRTQLPYALTTGAVALFVGVLPAGFGLPWWLLLAAGAAVLVVVWHLVGRSPDPAVSPRG